jgi:cytoskeletal protein CcmA (bactofilin family)
MVSPRRLRPALAVALLAVLLCSPGAVAGAGPAVAPVSSPTDTAALGTTVVVPAGETTNGSVTASGTRVVVAGRHEGDLKLYGGTVLVAGNVTGDVQAFGAAVRITGTVGGSLVAYGGTVELADTARVDGLLNTGGSRVHLNGTVNSSVQATGGRVVLGESATVARAVTYDATLVDRGGTVAGEVAATDRFLGPLGTLLCGLRLLPMLAPLLGLAAGLAGRRWLPATATDLTATLAEHPGRSLRAGVGGLLGAGGGGLLLVASVVGLPLVVVLGCLAGLAALLGLAITQRAVGRALLRHVGDESPSGPRSLVVGAGLGLLVGVPALAGVAPLSAVALGLLAVASIAGAGTLVADAGETADGWTLASRFG